MKTELAAAQELIAELGAQLVEAESTGTSEHRHRSGAMLPPEFKEHAPEVERPRSGAMLPPEFKERTAGGTSTAPKSTQAAEDAAQQAELESLRSQLAELRGDEGGMASAKAAPARKTSIPKITSALRTTGEESSKSPRMAPRKSLGSQATRTIPVAGPAASAKKR